MIKNVLKSGELLILISLFAVVLAACGSGGGGGSDNESDNSNISGNAGSIYEVYGGDTYISGTDGYNPEKHGYTLLGTASCTQVFSGSYSYYIIVTRPVNIAYVDTVQGSNCTYYGTNVTGTTTDYTNIGGAPDSTPAAIGGMANGTQGGYIIIDTTGDSLSSITVYITQPSCGGIDTNLLDSISISPVNATITSGSTLQYLATGIYPDGSTQNITTSVTWTSSNTSVAPISNTGMATAINAGTTTITATLGSISVPTTLFVIDNKTEWLENWKTAIVGVIDPLYGSFSADSGYWTPIMTPTSNHCNDISVYPGDRLRLYAVSDGKQIDPPCQFSVASSLVLQADSQSEQLENKLMTKNTTFSGNWNLVPSINAGELGYDIEGIIEIIILGFPDGRSFNLRYSHGNSIFEHPTVGYCNSASPYSVQCVSIPDQFERNIYDDLVTLYGDEFIASYNDNIFDFVTIQIQSRAFIDFCDNYSDPDSPYYFASCESSVSTTLAVDDLMIWEK